MAIRKQKESKDIMRTPASGEGQLIVHGHGYQPQRPVPFSRIPHTFRVTPLRESTAPPGTQNWTDAIFRQCFGPLMVGGPAESAYRYMSFNFGPTLVESLRDLHPDFLPKLKAANDLSAQDQEGHGNAIGHPLFHVILPLEKEETQRVLVAWGIEHFIDTFGRRPEGFWLPECAVSLETLSLLAEFGIKYVILSPFSVNRIKGEDGEWRGIEYRNGFPKIPSAKPHRIALPNSAQIHAFFYDGEIAKEFAFSNILNEEDAVSRIDAWIQERLREDSDSASVGVDAETFGHHKQRGQDALVRLLHSAVTAGGYRVTNFGWALAKALRNSARIPEVEIKDRSAWSCSHGLEHWASNCGCFGDNPWREPLRAALQDLAAKADAIFMSETGPLLRNPQRAREEYIHVLLGHKSFESFIHSQLKEGMGIDPQTMHRLSPVFNSLVPRYAMSTSCAWFFAGMGHETGLSLISAAELTRELRFFNASLEREFVRLLSAIGNNPGKEDKNAADLYYRYQNAVGF